MMGAAAPDGAPPRRFSNEKIERTPLGPPCLGEALRRVSIIYNMIFMVPARTESIHLCFSSACF
jgi:hypothetical protein